jgi:phenylalanine-4-hydroxylase
MANLGLEESSLVSADVLVAQDWARRYSETSHAAWASLLNSLQPLSDKTSCSKILRGQEAIGLDTQRIPKFEDLTKRLSASTGWEIVGANGFIPNEAYFTHLADKRFPMACDIRSLDGSQFQEFPDLFHDIYGHTPLLIYPEVSNLLQSSARAILKAIKLGREDLVKKIAAAYWFTIEVGLVKEHGDIRVYGAAIASSPKEIMFATADKRPNLIRFDLDRVMRTEYDMLDVQATYFVLSDIDALKNLANVDFFERALSLENMPTLAPGELCPSDDLIQLGSNSQPAKSRKISIA